MGEADDLTVEALASLANDLVTTWAAKSNARLKRQTLARDVLIFSYSMHAHHLAHSCLKLAEQDLWIEGYPILRTCFEMAVSAQWLYATKEAVEISLYEAERNRKNLINSALAAQFIDKAEADKRLAEIQKQLDELEDAKKRGLPTKFIGVCEDLRGGDFLYLTYRMLSHYCHAGPGVADFYVRLDEDGWVKEFGDPNDTEADHRAALYQLCMSLIWAGRAADAIGKVTGRRRQLREAAKLLGVPDYLQLSDKAVIRSTKGKNSGAGKKVSTAKSKK